MAFSNITLATIRQRLLERWEDVPFWTDEEALLAINEALLLWNVMTGVWRQRHVITIFPNERDFALPAPIVYPKRIEFNGRSLDPTSLFSLDNGRPGWEGQKTTDSGIPSAPKSWAKRSLQIVSIWPHLGSGEGSLQIDGVADTPELVNDSDFIDFDDDHIGALLGYALHVASFKEGGTRFAGTQAYLQAFVSAAAEHNAALKASSFYRKAMGTWTQRQQNPTKVPTNA